MPLPDERRFTPKNEGLRSGEPALSEVERGSWLDVATPPVGETIAAFACRGLSLVEAPDF